MVGVELPQASWPIERSLDELERLAATAGAVSIGRMTQRLDHPVARSFIGSGKVEELCSLCHSQAIDVVIFDDELTPAQQSYLEKAVGEPVIIIDRTALILDIFGMHASTREGTLQVQLAQLQYLLPRLRGMWSHLAKEQTRGGIGSRFGQGESQLEVDRRLIRNKIAHVRAQLQAVERRRGTQSKERLASYAYRVALAGYTNAGKSSIINQLTGSNVLAQDKLFATLDPTTRSQPLPGGRSMTITDTVGFIQKLPHGLVDAFKSTLSEVREADLILKVVDVGDEDWLLHLETVDRVLDDIGAGERPSVLVLNKIDLIDARELELLRRRYPDACLYSAMTGEGKDALIERIAREAARSDEPMRLLLPYAQGALLREIHLRSRVLEERYEQEGVYLFARVPKRFTSAVADYQVDDPSLG